MCPGLYVYVNARSAIEASRRRCTSCGTQSVHMVHVHFLHTSRRVGVSIFRSVCSVLCVGTSSHLARMRPARLQVLASWRVHTACENAHHHVCMHSRSVFAHGPANSLCVCAQLVYMYMDSLLFGRYIPVLAFTRQDVSERSCCVYLSCLHG
jgi:hypothetical protein